MFNIDRFIENTWDKVIRMMQCLRKFSFGVLTLVLAAALLVAGADAHAGDISAVHSQHDSLRSEQVLAGDHMISNSSSDMELSKPTQVPNKSGKHSYDGCAMAFCMSVFPTAVQIQPAVILVGDLSGLPYAGIAPLTIDQNLRRPPKTLI